MPIRGFVPPGWDDLFHVLNPSAVRRAAVADFMEKQSWPRVWIDRGSHPTHLETVMAWAVNEGRRDLAIWGGDGTLSRAVQALHELGALDKVRLVLVPAGTCNDFARKIRTPLWDAVTSAALNPLERRYDLGLVEHAEGKRVFVNNAGFGRRPDARREKRPSPILDIFRLEAQALQIETRDDEQVSRLNIKGLLAIVCNAPYFGGGLHFSKDVLPDDGRLNGFFLQDQFRLKILWSFFRGRSGHPLENGGLLSVSGTSIRVRTPGALYPQADGESASAGGVGEIFFKLMPRALTMLVPK